MTRRGIQVEPAHTPRRRRVTPFRLVAACMVMLGQGPVGGAWGSCALQRPRARLRDLMRDGLESLEAGVFSTAARDLGEATDVLDRLGRKDSTADLIRQRGREAAAAKAWSASLWLKSCRCRSIARSGADGPGRDSFSATTADFGVIMQSVLERPGERLDDKTGKRGRNTLPDAFEAEYPFAVGNGPCDCPDGCPGWFACQVGVPPAMRIRGR
ncbi:MAG: hypothetical protein CM1200mP2_34110 [Planctomycetaceae bacterium]|nr:MAG: hypothetical protein CM1200mP2_34110 [Planctomycetaceae bacterium]